jgi:hypothetical protein
MDTNTAQAVLAYCSLTVAILTPVTTAALIWYTIETSKLRNATQKQVEKSGLLLEEAQIQNEHSIQPIVTLEPANDLHIIEKGANMPAVQTVIRNLGSGAAFNISVEPLRGRNTTIRFVPTMSLGAGQRGPVLLVRTEDSEQVVSGAYELIQRMFHSNELDDGARNILHYADVNGKRYRTIIINHYDHQSREHTPTVEKSEPDT